MKLEAKQRLMAASNPAKYPRIFSYVSGLVDDLDIDQEDSRAADRMMDEVISIMTPAEAAKAEAFMKKMPSKELQDFMYGKIKNPPKELAKLSSAAARVTNPR